jgi:hypothetical protein
MFGLVSIHDANHAIRLREEFREVLEPNQVAGVLVSFDSGAVAGREPHTLAIQLHSQSPDLIHHYANLRVFLKRLPRFPLMD